MEEKGVRNKPEVLNIKDMRYGVLGGRIKADDYLLKERKLKGRDLTDDKLMKLEVLRSKLTNIRKYKADDMVVIRSRLQKMLHRYGFFMSPDLPDAVNAIVIRMVEEAIARVYNLPGRMERITVRPSDLPWMIQ